MENGADPEPGLWGDGPDETIDRGLDGADFVHALIFW